MNSTLPELPSKPPFDLWNRFALLTCAEMRAAEALAVGRGGKTFFDLMQVAGGAVAKAVIQRFAPCRVLVLCGAGNNGGDGYVAAEALRKAGFAVRVGALAPVMALDAKRAAKAWQGMTLPLDDSLLDDTDLVVDALFGTGLTRPLEGTAAQVVRGLAARHLPVVCADMPSGIDGDTGRLLGLAPRAQVTVTFFRKKRGHALLPALGYCGETIVADTGMDATVLDEIAPRAAENDPALWEDLWPQPTREGHKYDRGHAVIFGGPLLTGASRLAARAAQRIGAGLVTLAAPREAWAVYAQAMESVMIAPYDTAVDAQKLLDDPKRNAVLIGPGFGTEEPRLAFVRDVLASGKPCVLDADALTLLARAPQNLSGLFHEKCVLTPHEGEFARLFGGAVDLKADKITRAGQAAALTGAVVLLKGADTVIAAPDGYVVVNINAPPWLATGGAGDVLAGMIVGLLAAGMPPFAAACAAAFAHGAIATRHGPGLIAEDLVAGIGNYLDLKMRK